MDVYSVSLSIFDLHNIKIVIMYILYVNTFLLYNIFSCIGRFQ